MNTWNKIWERAPEKTRPGLSRYPFQIFILRIISNTKLQPSKILTAKNRKFFVRIFLVGQGREREQSRDKIRLRACSIKEKGMKKVSSEILFDSSLDFMNEQ